MINEKQVTGMKPLTWQQQFKGMNRYIMLIIYGENISWLSYWT